MENKNKIQRTALDKILNPRRREELFLDSDERYRYLLHRHERGSTVVEYVIYHP